MDVALLEPSYLDWMLEVGQGVESSAFDMPMSHASAALVEAVPLTMLLVLFLSSSVSLTCRANLCLVSFQHPLHSRCACFHGSNQQE